MKHLSLLLVLLAGLRLCASPSPVAPPSPFPALGPGMSLTVERDGDAPLAIVVLKVARDHREYRLVSAMGRDTLFGLASVPDAAKALPPELGTPVAAVNGDWFQLPAGPYQGDLINLFIHRGQLISLPSWGDTFWVDRDGNPHIDRVTVDLAVTWPDGTKTPLGLDGPRADGEAVLYTSILGPSTRTKDGRELILARPEGGPWPALRVGAPIAARVREVREAGDTPLGPDAMVLSVGPDLVGKLPKLEQDAAVTIAAVTTPDLAGVDVAIGGGPVLLRDGKIPDRPKQDEPRHPRTVLGWNDTHLYFIAIDGRRPGWSMGLTIPELSALAQRLGCANAINLDGGGSTTLWLPDQVVNMPSDGKPRRVGNALALVKQ